MKVYVYIDMDMNMKMIIIVSSLENLHFDHIYVHFRVQVRDI